VRRHISQYLLYLCAPSYLSVPAVSMCAVVSLRCMQVGAWGRRLHSSGTTTCVIPWSWTHLGDMSFDVAGPQLWNKLPASLRSSDSLIQLRRQLKTYLFVKDKAAMPSDFRFRHRIHILLLTYLSYSCWFPTPWNTVSSSSWIHLYVSPQYLCVTNQPTNHGQLVCISQYLHICNSCMENLEMSGILLKVREKI